MFCVVLCRVVLFRIGVVSSCFAVLCCVTLCRVISSYVVLRFVVFCGVVLVTFFDHFGCHVRDIFDVFFVSIFGHVF